MLRGLETGVRKRRATAASLLLLISGTSSIETLAATTPKNSYDRSLYSQFDSFRRSDGRVSFGDYSISRKAQILGALYRLWPNAILPYRFQPALAAAKQQAFLTACQQWTTNTPLKCQAWSGTGPYFTVRERTGTECGDDIRTSTFSVSCANGLGPPLSGEQRFLSVHPNSWGSQALLEHELGHVIGFMHEQQRPDRESYLIFKAQNVQFTYDGQSYDNASQFRQYDSALSYSDYDYFSIMHYRNCAFTSPASGCTDTGDFNLQAIAPRQCDKHAIGYDNNSGGAGITALDRESVEKAYMSRLMAVFNEARSGECGSQVYSPDQVTLACGAACGAASPVRWSRIAGGYSRKWCTGDFVTSLPDGPGICKGFGQEFYQVTSSSTKWVDQCLGQIFNGAGLNRETIQCGCRSQTLAASCFGQRPVIDATKLPSLLNGTYQRDRAAGRLLSLVISMQTSGVLKQDAADLLIEITRRDYIRSSFGPRGQRLARSLEAIASRKAAPMTIDVDLVEQLARRARLGNFSK